MVRVVFFSVISLVQGHDESDELLQATKIYASRKTAKSAGWRFIDSHVRCANIPDKAVEYAEDSLTCQGRAEANGHDYFQFNDVNKLCATAAYCFDAFEVKNPWQVFKNEDSAEICTCENGRPTNSSKYCPQSSEHCALCDPGFTLKAGRCEETQLWGCTAEGQVCNAAKGKVKDHTQQSCQERAATLGHRYSNFNSKKSKCWTGDYCQYRENKEWSVYTNPDVVPQQAFKLKPWQYSNSAYNQQVRYDWDTHKDDFSQVCPQFTEEMPDQDVFLRTHNYFRCLHGHEKLIWNAKLEKLAGVQAQKCAENGKLANAGSYALRPSCAENLKAYGPPQLAVTSWYDSFDTDDTRAFTAMLWRSTTQVGCSTKLVHGFKVHSCLYAEDEGNIGGMYEKNAPPSEWINKRNFCCADAFNSTPVSECDADYQYLRKIVEKNERDEGKVVGKSIS